MSMAVGSKLELQPGSWKELIYDVYIGTIVGSTHSISIVSQWWWTRLIRPIVRLFRSYDLNDIRMSNDIDQSLKVVATGFGRTGTYSLALALEELGFPCLHTQHLYEHEAILTMWADEVFLPSIQENKFAMRKPDLQMIVSHGFQATADLPMALYWEQILQEYPDCKFILTTRENSEVWFKSWDVLTKSITQPTFAASFFFTGVRQYSYYLRWLFSLVNKDDAFLTAPFPLPVQNKQAATASYEEHNQRIRENIPRDRLLEYNVKDGWQPLCSFLSIDDCPVTPFPRTNSARSVQVQSISAIIFPLLIVLFVLFYTVARTVRAVTGKTVLQWASEKLEACFFAVGGALFEVKKKLT